MNKTRQSKLVKENPSVSFLKENKTVREKIRKKHKLPLEIMILIMNKALEENDFDMALEIAYKTAPYCHPKLSSAKVEMKQVKTLKEMTTEELKILVGQKKL